MIESGGLEHLPDSRVAPVVWHGLGPDIDVEIIVSSFQVGWHSPVGVPIKADHVLLQFLEGLVKGSFVILALALAKTDLAPAVSDEDEDTSVIDSIQTGHIGDTVRVHENQSPV